jgi:hypothetical protein
MLLKHGRINDNDNRGIEKHRIYNTSDIRLVMLARAHEGRTLVNSALHHFTLDRPE